MKMELTQALLEDEWRELVTNEAEATYDVPVELAVAAAITNGREDAALDRYYPPRPSEREAFDAYMFSWNTEWAKNNGRTLLR